MREYTMYKVAAKKTGGKTRKMAWIVYTGKEPVELYAAALAAYPITSTANINKSDSLKMTILTNSANDEWYAEPHPVLNHFPCMKSGQNSKHCRKDDGGR